MNKKIRLAILEKYDSQTVFAQAIGRSESYVSRVIHRRRKLSSEESIAWGKALDCDPALLGEVYRA